MLKGKKLITEQSFSDNVNNKIRRLRITGDIMARLRRPTFGFLSHDNTEEYEFQVWSGVVAAAKKKDINLICYSGGMLNHPARAEKNRIYNLISTSHLDGLITVSGVLGVFIDYIELHDFLRKFSPLPMISIGIPFEDIPSILADNTNSIDEVVEHMITVHGAKKIAFIKGAKDNTEAELRFDAYKSCLARHGIEYNEDLVVQGNFIRESGTQAIIELLDERQVTFDTLVASNDLMALYAMKELQRRGFSIPDEIRITGFDDLAESVYENPALTTVTQPLYELGNESVMSLLKLINNEPIEHKKVLPAGLKVRNSCGCESISRFPKKPPIDLKSSQTDLVQNDKSSSNLILSALEASAQTEIGIIEQHLDDQLWFDELTTLFFKEIQQTGNHDFFNYLGKCVPLTLKNGIEPTVWQAFFSKLFDIIIEINAFDLDVSSIFGFIKKTLWYLGGMFEQFQKQTRISNFEIYNSLMRINEALRISVLPEDLLSVFKNELPLLGIKSCYLALYTNQKTCLESQKFVSFGECFDNVDSAVPYPSHELIPGGIQQVSNRMNFILLPLYLKDESFGYLLLDIGKIDGTIYESIAQQISSALKADEQIKEIQDYSMKLEKKVEERTAELQETQKNLVKAAHQAGMAEIATGVMHNAGNILNSVSVSAQEINNIAKSSGISKIIEVTDYIKQNKDNLENLFTEERKTVLIEYFSALEEALKEENTKLVEESKRLTDKIRLTIETLEMHQKYAKGVFLTERLRLNDAVEEVLNLQLKSLQNQKINLVKSYLNENPSVMAQRSKLLHVLYNLLKNAEDALKNSNQNPKTIEITTGYNKNRSFFISVTDNGQGIEEKNLTKIFNYGFTTKAEGHGFGLHTCANFMSEMNGTISVTSDGPNKGTTFTICFGEN